jgi:hypothetical protein
MRLCMYPIQAELLECFPDEDDDGVDADDEEN